MFRTLILASGASTRLRVFSTSPSLASLSCFSSSSFTQCSSEAPPPEASSTESAAVAPDCGVLFQKRGNVMDVILNRPKALNALDLDMIRAIYPRYEKYEDDETVHAILLRGEGEKAFCAGGDIRSLYDANLNKSKSTIKQDFFREEYMLNHRISQLSTPQVAILDGITMGGGVGLTVHGTFRVATERTLFAMPESAIGFFCDVGGSYFLSRMKSRLGYYLALTGARLKGVDNFYAGIATHYIPHEKIDELCDALSQIKKPIDAQTVLDDFQPSELPEPDVVQKPFLSDVNKLLDAISVEEIIARLEAAENKEFAEKTLNTLSKMSPTSLKVIFRQLQQGAHLPLRECLQMEYCISQAYMKSPKSDFFEGVRALLVDRDNAPKWNPTKLSDISEEDVDKYFASLGRRNLELPPF
mmetsp:Transcript_8973/g.22558  ORF Transcript_8973/g.22558 Transcript_8973/m.22558 type:complete len:414 (-) Transcript_8973:32-1273(-)